MSIIQQIREKYAAVSIAVIALSLVGFILTDYFTGKSGRMGSQSTEVGEVNGKSININAFDSKVQQVVSNYTQQGMEVKDELRQQIIDYLWNNEIEETLLNSEYSKLGLSFTAADLNEALYGDNPPPILAQQFKDANTGAYDANAARQYVNSLRKKKANDKERVYFEQNIIDPLISFGLRKKYAAMLAASAYYPKWLFDKDIADQNSIASISYVAVPYATISDSSIKVTDADISAYINKHKNEFKQEESRTISYVTFDASPSSADSAKAFNDIVGLKQGFVASTDAGQFTVANNSAIQYYDGFVLKSAMQVPNADSIRAIPVGAVYGPYLDGGNYVLAKMVEKREMPDSVKFRHILIVTKDQNGQQVISDSIAKLKADSIAGVLAKGGDFLQLADKFSADKNGKEKGWEYEFTSQQFANATQMFTKDVAEFVFYGSKGSKKVIKTDIGFFYVEVVDQKHIEPAYKIAYLARTIEPSDETTNTASTAAAQFAAESRSSKQFEESLRKKKLSPRIAEVKPGDYTIMGVGSARSLVKWIYENKVGSVSEPTSIGNEFIVALITEEKEEGTVDAKSVRPQLEPVVRNQKKAKEIIAKIGTNKDLNAIASMFKTNVLRADSVSFFSPFIQGVGMEPRVSGAAFNPAVKGKTSDPIPGNGGVYIIRTENVGLQPSVGADYTSRKVQMEQGIQQNTVNGSVPSLRKAAKVKDRRIKFY
ncbi:MAG: SurA N-terminal domain-containing protein [Lacibacter sp.]